MPAAGDVFGEATELEEWQEHHSAGILRDSGDSVSRMDWNDEIHQIFMAV